MSGTGYVRGRLGGLAAVTIDGDAWDVVGDLEYSSVTLSRETMKGQTRTEGFGEMPMQCFLSMNLRDRHDVTVYSLNQKNNCTVNCQLANGKTVYGAGMWQVGEITVRTQEGSFSIRFEGPSVIEQTI